MKMKEKCAFYISVILYRMTLDMVYCNVLSAEPIFGEYVNTYHADFCNLIVSYILILKSTHKQQKRTGFSRLYLYICKHTYLHTSIFNCDNQGRKG